jgi:hypothetical protein
MIHQLLWSKRMQDKDDKFKLKKLVSRVRSFYNPDINFKNGCCFALDSKRDVA